MKHPTLYILSLVLPLLALSCSTESDVVPATPRPIAFGSHSGATRDATTAPSLSSIYETFRVWGFKLPSDITNAQEDRQSVFGDKGYAVEYDGQVWDYTRGDYPSHQGQQQKYWDDDALEYRFFGLAPYKIGQPHITYLDAQGHEIADQTTLTDFRSRSAHKARLSYEVSPQDQRPFYYSNLAVVRQNQISSYWDTPVPLTFSQPMARVRYVFTYATGQGQQNPANIHITQSDFRPAPKADDDNNTYFNPHEKGSLAKATVTVDYPLTGTESIGVQVVPATTDDAYTLMPHHYLPWPDDNPEDDGTREWYYVVPVPTGQQNGDYILEATINGLPRTAIVPADKLQWQAGHEYTYVFRINETSVGFEGTMDVHTKFQVGYVWNVAW